MAVADPGQSSAEPTGITTPGLGLDSGLVEFPFLAVGRIGALVIVTACAQLPVGERAAELDVVGVPTVRRFQKQVGLADGERLRLRLVAEDVDFGVGIDLQNLVLRGREHPTGAATGIADGADDGLFLDDIPIHSDQQQHHEPDDFTGRKVFAGIFVEGFIEPAHQFLKDVAHLMVGNLVGMEINDVAGKPLHHQEQQAVIVELGDGVWEVELVQNLPHVIGKTVQVGAQVRCEAGRIIEQFLEIVFGPVVEGEARSFAELGIEVLQLALQLGVRLQDFQLRRRQHAVNAPEHRERQDHVLVFAAFEPITEQFRNGPQKVDLFAKVVHRRSDRACFGPTRIEATKNQRRRQSVSAAARPIGFGSMPRRLFHLSSGQVLGTPREERPLGARNSRPLSALLKVANELRFAERKSKQPLRRLSEESDHRLSIPEHLKFAGQRGILAMHNLAPVLIQPFPQCLFVHIGEKVPML